MGYDQELSELYRNMDSGDTNRPNVEALKANIQETIHCMEMSYGTTGSLFRSGSRQTFFAAQVVRYADIYAASVLNLLYYPTNKQREEELPMVRSHHILMIWMMMILMLWRR